MNRAWTKPEIPSSWRVERSSRTTADEREAVLAVYIFSVTARTDVSNEWPALNPDWLGSH